MSVIEKLGRVALGQAILFFAHTRYGEVVFDRVIWVIQEQEKLILDGLDKAQANAAKRKGALAMMEMIGLELSENLARQALELAIDYLKHTQDKLKHEPVS